MRPPHLTLGIEQHVVWLQVAVNVARIVYGLQAARHRGRVELDHVIAQRVEGALLAVSLIDAARFEQEVEVAARAL